MKHNNLLGVICFIFAIALLPLEAAAKEVVLKLATWGPPKHYVAEARADWINEVNTAAAGKVKIVDYPGGQLYGPKEMHSAVAKGSVDMGLVLQPAMLAMVPMLQGVYLPFAFDSIDDAAKAYTGESLEIIEKAMEKKRLKLVVISWTDGVQMFSNKKNIQSVDDFKGLRVLSASPMFSEIMVKLGAAPDTSIPQTEQYMALQRGVSDAMANSAVGGYFQKSHEVAKYLTKMDMSYATIFICMNLKTWNKLPKDVQELMVDLGKKQTAITLAAAKGWEAKFTAEMEKEGASVTRIPAAERDKIKNISKDVWVQWAKDNGKEAQRLLDLNIK
jgi:TRAP-type C4-dicarboxylate transport system substrate-binding protein